MKDTIEFKSGKIQKNHKGQYQIFVSRFNRITKKTESEWVLLEDFTTRELVKFWNFITSGPSIKTLADRERGIETITKALDNMEVPANKPVQAHKNEERIMAKKEETTKKKSYGVIIRELLEKKKGIITRDDIIEACGCDERNAAVAMSILKNPNRTKEPIDWLYDKGARTYYLATSTYDAVAAAEKREKAKKASGTTKTTSKKK